MFLDVSTELLRRGYGIRFRPTGHSMHPAIRDGEAVTVEPVKASEVKRGDIILYLAGRGLTAHRVVLIYRESTEQETSFILQGDACQTCDEPVRAEQILGKAVMVERDGRRVNLASRRAHFAHALYTHLPLHFVRVRGWLRLLFIQARA